MTSPRDTNPARCFLIVDVGRGQPTHCPEPVEWHGSLRSGDGGWYRVWACDVHAEHLDDAKPITRRLDVANATADAIVMLSWK